MAFTSNYYSDTKNLKFWPKSASKTPTSTWISARCASAKINYNHSKLTMNFAPIFRSLAYISAY